jgi:hypothetical protein
MTVDGIPLHQSDSGTADFNGWFALLCEFSRVRLLSAAKRHPGVIHETMRIQTVCLCHRSHGDACRRGR